MRDNTEHLHNESLTLNRTILVYHGKAFIQKWPSVQKASIEKSIHRKKHPYKNHASDKNASAE